MAKIEVLKGDRTTVSPVGIVRMGGGGRGREMQRAGKELFESSYRSLVEKETQKGQEEARLALISARDKNNNLVFPETPKSLSYIAKQAYEPIANKRYMDALTIDINANAKQIAAKHERDPDGFAEEFGTWLDTTIEQSGKFAGVVESVGLVSSKQYQVALFTDKENFEDELAFKNSVIVLHKAIPEIQAMAAAGVTGSAREAVNVQTNKLDFHMLEHGDRTGSAFRTEHEKKLRYAFTSGDIINISNKLADLQQITNPDQKQPMLSADLNYMAIALEMRTFDFIPKNVQERLKKAGFTEEYVNDPIMAGLHRQLAGEVRVRQGTVQEQYNAEKDSRLAGAALNRMANNENLSLSDSDRIVKLSPITSAMQLSSNLNTIMNPPEDKAEREAWDINFGAFHHLTFRQTGMLPTIAKEYLESVDTMPADQIPVAVAMYQQATQFNRGSFVEKMSRGLSDKTVVMYETLGAVMDTIGPAQLPEFFASFRENQALPKDERTARVNGALGEKKGSIESNVRRFVSDTLDDPSPAELGFYTQYADDLLIATDKKTTERILKEANKTIFAESKFLHPTLGRSRFTPERAYTDETTMSDFQTAVKMKLGLISLNNSKKLGVNVFLIPDTREGTALPVYNLVDADKNPLIYQGKMMQVGNQYVIQKMKERTTKTIKELRAEAEAAEGRYVQLIKNQTPFTGISSIRKKRGLSDD
jgi:hypothetical protein